ncbi:hypothetical protein CQW23_04041 [Capsicum baccatum]|uniref:Ubiquitin-like protease family profile domain-containing protein n=1 Tax=Capsicum baccatum TaxID=33114 RepID=A0A2G2XDJ1_CAPBA|nr:hypothetical protein CQW23_04041 [Capsicum baccatum]
MVEYGKYQFFPWVKVFFSRLMASLRQEFSIEKQLYRLGGIPQVLNVWMFELCSNVDTKVAVKEGNNIPLILNWRCSYANIVPTADEFEKLDLARTSFVSDHHGTSSMPSSSKNQDQRSYRVNLPQVIEDHDSFDDFSSTLSQFLMRESIHMLANQADMEEKSKVDADSTSTLNRKHLASRQECDPSDAIVDDAGPTSTDSVGKENDKSIEMEDDKANQAPSFLKKGKKKLASKEWKKYPFEGYHITEDSTIVEMEVFEEWINDGLYKQHTKKKDNDDHYKVNCSTVEFSQLDFVVAFPKSKNWLYLMYQQNKCWNDEDLATQDASARTDEVADMEMSLINTIKGLSTCAGQPWHMVNEVFVSINCDGTFHWVPTDWIALKSYKENSKRDSFQVEYVSEIAQQDSGSLDYGVFVAVYADYLSEGLDIPCSGIDTQYHRLRYASLLCKYGSKKAENGYFSENDDPPRPRSKFSPKETNRVFHIK